MENLMKSKLVDVINAMKGGHLPDWTHTVSVETEDTTEKVFDIVDTKGNPGSIVREKDTGHATYYNGDEGVTYTLRFIKYEEFVNQFREFSADGKILKDWCKNVSRPDYMCYTTDKEKYFIVHELSEGSINNKLSKARTQLAGCIQFLMKSDEVKAYLDKFERRICYVSAKGGVEYSPNGMADSFNEIYNNIPTPNPIKCSTFARRGFEAYETRVVKL